MAAFPIISKADQTIRIVTYNTQDDVSPPTPASVLPYLETVIEGIGQQKYVGDNVLQLPDVIALQETTSNSTTVSPVVSALNSFYGKSNFNYSNYQATQSGSATIGNGPNALIYNQATLNLNQSIGVGTPSGSSNGEYRQIVRYQLQPLVDKGTSNGFFYVYDSHYKSGSAGTVASGTTMTDGQERNLEAGIIRNDEAANLPANASVIYVGDYNGDGSTETAYQTIVAANSPSGVMQGAGIDPLNVSNNFNLNFGANNSGGILTESDTDLRYRDDLQVMTANVYNGSGAGLHFISGSYHTFGNDGELALKGNVSTGTTSALNDIIGNGSLTPSTVFAAMNGSLGSDHLPIVADYTISVLANGIWAGGTGNWSNAADWSNSVVPNSSSIEVKIDNGNTVASAVTLDINATIEDLTLDANDSLSITAGNSLVMSGPNASAFNGKLINAGSLRLTASTNTGTFNTSGTLISTANFTNSGTAILGGVQNWSAGTVFTNTAGTALFNTDAGSPTASTLSVNVSGGSVTFASTQHLAGLNISSGVTVTAARNGSGGRSVIDVASAPTLAGTVDLTTNDLDAANTSLASVLTLIKSAYTAGKWTGTGITSSTAGASTTHLTTLGVIQNNQSGTALFTATGSFDGVTPGASDILVKYTEYGDANLDGKVDGTDYSRIDNGYLTHATTWFDGDFNYDGVVNGSDYTLIDNAFNTQGATLTSTIADPQANVTAQIAGTSAVPEPGLISLLGMIWVGNRRYRRRRLA